MVRLGSDESKTLAAGVLIQFEQKRELTGYHSKELSQRVQNYRNTEQARIDRLILQYILF